MGFIDATSNNINRTVQGIKREDVANVESTLAMHAWFARNTEKYQKAHFA